MKKDNMVIMQRADNYSHGFPYMVVDISDVIGTIECTFYAKQDELHKYTDSKYKVSEEINAFGNCKVVETQKEYKTYMFKTLKQANNFIDNF